MELDGFLADSSKPLHINIKTALKQMNSTAYFSRPANMTCHNYCTSSTMPPGTRHLLGLGLNFCIKRDHPSNNYKKTIDRFKNDVRRIATFKDKEEDTGYIPGMYIKSDYDFAPTHIQQSRNACPISSPTF